MDKKRSEETQTPRWL